MRYRFEGCELDADRRELRAGGEVRHLEPQVFDLLHHLIENRDRLVSRDELIAAIWNGRIVSESAIDARIHAARKAVNDDGRQQACIKTMPRRGYRFVAAVEMSSDNVASVARETTAVSALPSPLMDKPTLAVLPFANLSSGRDQAHFVDGFTEEIITALSRFRWFFVTARESIFDYRDRSIDVNDVSRQLGVRYLLQGSVRRAKRDVRISARLLDAANGTCIWSDRYDRRLDGLFELQDEIARTVVSAIEPEIAAAERTRARRRPTESLDAWDRCQRGYWHFWRLTERDVQRAERHFLTAIDKDRNINPAYTGLAMLYTSQVLHGWTKDSDATLHRAEQAATTAIALDDRDALAHAVRGRIHTTRWQFEPAISQFALALELNPSLVYALYGMGIVLFWAGRADDAVPFLDRAVRQSPRDPLRWAFELHIGFCHYSQNEPDEAIGWFNRALRHPTANFWPHLGLAMTYAGIDRPAEAASAVAEARRRQPGLSLQQIAPLLQKPEGLRSVELLRRSGLPED